VLTRSNTDTTREQTLERYPNLALVSVFFAPGTKGSFTPGWNHQPGLKVLQPLVPVGNTKGRPFSPG